MPPMTVSPGTHEQYLRRAHQLFLQASPCGEGISIEQLVEFMLAYRYRVSKSTIRVYFASVTYALEMKALPIPGLTNDKVRWAKEELIMADLSMCPKAIHTSAKRRKHVEKEHFLIILDDLKNEAARGRKNDTAQRAACFLAASMACGLRPVEWANASVDDTTNLLHARTAKTPGGVFRDIPIQTAKDLQAIREHLTLMSPYIVKGPKAVQSYIASCRSRLRRTVKKIFGPDLHMALYDCRHQFAANLRGAGVEQESLRAWMGHGNYRTTKLYGRKASSWSGTSYALTRKRATPSRPMRATLRP